MARSNAVLDGPGFGILGSFSKVGSNVLSFGFILYIVSRIITFFPKFKFPSVPYTKSTYFLAFLLSFIVGRKLNFLSWKLACDNGEDGRGCSAYINAPNDLSEEQKRAYIEKGLKLKDPGSAKLALEKDPAKYARDICTEYNKNCLRKIGSFKEYSFCWKVSEGCGKFPFKNSEEVLLASKDNTLTLDRLKAYKGNLEALTLSTNTSVLHFEAERGNIAVMKAILERGHPDQSI